VVISIIDDMMQVWISSYAYIIKTDRLVTV